MARIIRIIGGMRILGMGMLLVLPLQLLLFLRSGLKEVGIHVTVCRDRQYNQIIFVARASVVNSWFYVRTGLAVARPKFTVLRNILTAIRA